jgi:hypothetical protein
MCIRTRNTPESPSTSTRIFSAFFRPSDIRERQNEHSVSWRAIARCRALSSRISTSSLVVGVPLQIFFFLKVSRGLSGLLLLAYFENRRRTCGIKITHSPITLANISIINLVSIFRCSSPPRNPVYTRCVFPSVVYFSLSSHRHSKKGFIFNSRLIDS